MFKEFTLSDVLKFEQAQCIPSKGNLIDGDIPYVTRSAVNNGKTCTCGNTDKVNRGNCISVGGEGGAVFYQFEDWVAGNNMCKLWRDGLEKEEYIYIISLMNKITHVYSYTNARTQEKIRKEFLSLPVIENPNPDHKYTVDDIDWQYMRDYIKKLFSDYIKELDAYLQATGLNNYELTEEDKKVLNQKVNTKEFVMHDIFEPLSAKKAVKTNVRNVKDNEYCVPVVYAKFGDNGIMYWGRKGEFTTYSNVISIVYNGVISAGKCYAQENETGILAESYLIRYKYGEIPFLANLYMSKVIEHKIYPLYSRETLAIWNNRVENDIIPLPITQTGEPDFDYMERYIRAIEKVVIADVVKYKDQVIEATKKVVNE